MCRRVSDAVLTRPGSPRGVLNDVVHPDAGGGLHRLFRWPHDPAVVADVRHGEPVRPRELADGRHQRIGGRPADTDVYQVFADGVVGDRQPLGETRIDLVITQRVGAVERREGSDEVAIEGPDRRGGALNAVIVMRLSHWETRSHHWGKPSSVTASGSKIKTALTCTQRLHSINSQLYATPHRTPTG